MTGQTAHRGIELYQQQQYPAAETELFSATHSRPDWAEGWRYLGFAQYAQGKQDQAAASIEKAIGLEPDNAEARYGLGLVRAAQSKTDEAIACFDEALMKHSGHIPAKAALIGGLVFRGQKQIEDRDFEHGEHDLERAIKLDRKAPEPVIALVKYYVAYGQEGRGAKVLETALATVVGNPEVDTLALQLNVKASAAAVAAQHQAQAKQAVTQVDEIPCPVCKQLIMKWAIQCPHCHTQLKARPSSFDHHKGGPSTTWQEVAYYIIASLFLLDGFRPILLAFVFTQVGFSGLNGLLVTLGVVKIGVAIGLLFRVETLQFIAKIFCWIDLMAGGRAFLVAMMLSQWGMFAYSFISFILTAMMIYLIGYMDD